MNPIRSNKRGSLILKRKFAGVPPIRRATGTTDLETFEAIDAMCTVLYKKGRLDLLEGVARGTLHPMLLWDRYRTDRLDSLPRADVLPPFFTTFATWTDAADVAESTTRSRTTALAALKQHGKDRDTLGEAPAILRAYRRAAAGNARSFNLARSAVQAFFRDQLGKGHALWRAVTDIPVLKATKKKRKPQPLSPDALRELVKKQGNPHGLITWTMATSGMGPKEYFEDGFEITDDFLEVHGQKRGGRERLVPRIGIAVPPSRSLRRWKASLTKHAKGLQPYDLRRTFANLMVEAGIPANRRKMYMGHGARTETEKYERADIMRWLREDANAMRAVLGEGPEPGLRLVKAS